ncbi:porin family protein [uncultured Shewanella sp.]|uniref:porin family protein n=1 Tax=uncultured Shewanella sp. TaxID=173975 RepID=UPI00261C3673|nr:porin family protein [uncultured Shewanella sp.]
MKKTIIPALIFSTTCSTSAIANTEGFYLGGEFGNTNLEIARLTIDDRATSYGLYTGYQFNDWFALEGKMSKTGNYHLNEELLLEYSDNSGNQRIATVYSQWDISTTTYSLTPKLTLQLNDVLSLYSKLGVNYTKLSMDGTVSLFDETYFMSHPSDKTEGWGYTQTT